MNGIDPSLEELAALELETAIKKPLASSKTIFLKGCSRCQGDLLPDSDGDLKCLQCGRTPVNSSSKSSYLHKTSESQKILKYLNIQTRPYVYKEKY